MRRMLPHSAPLRTPMELQRWPTNEISFVTRTLTPLPSQLVMCYILCDLLQKQSAFSAKLTPLTHANPPTNHRSRYFRAIFSVFWHASCSTFDCDLPTHSSLTLVTKFVNDLLVRSGKSRQADHTPIRAEFPNVTPRVSWSLVHNTVVSFRVLAKSVTILMTLSNSIASKVAPI